MRYMACEVLSRPLRERGLVVGKFMDTRPDLVVGCAQNPIQQSTPATQTDWSAPTGRS